MPTRQFKTDPEVEGHESPDLSAIQPVPGNSTASGRSHTRVYCQDIQDWPKGKYDGLTERNSKATSKHPTPISPALDHKGHNSFMLASTIIRLHARRSLTGHPSGLAYPLPWSLLLTSYLYHPDRHPFSTPDIRGKLPSY